jgi:hypothetical protein
MRRPEEMSRQLEYIAKQDSPDSPQKPHEERRDINWLYSNMESFKAMSPEAQMDVLREALESKLLSIGLSLDNTGKILKGKDIVQILTLLDNEEGFAKELEALGIEPSN